ncbi:hypothetical protein DV738_g5282, partial [Chaetothyriales sp. CBS 135597]
MDTPSDSSRKRRERSESYTELSKQGKVPKSDSPPFEAYLAEHGIIADEVKGDLFVSEDSKELCEKMLEAQYENPLHTQFPLSKFLLVWNRLRTRNEFRVNRDLTPLLVPSPELLFFCGHEELEHIAEEVCADFTKAKPLAGPKPRPDLSIGIDPSAFSDEEIAKLKNHSSPERATLFTDNLYYPFLLCETKCGNQVVSRADRQNIRSSSMAVNAIIQLYQVLDDNQVSKLSGQTLVFSISHTDEQVKIYGHYAVIQGAQVTFYRHRIDSFNLGPGKNADNRKKAYDFVREVYNTFYPAHLKRIQDALKQMNDPRARASMSIDQSDSQEGWGSTVPSSGQTNPEFRKPDLPAGKKGRGKVAELEQWFRNQVEMLKGEKAEQERRHAEQERRFAEQERRYAEEKADQERRFAEQERRYAEEKAEQDKRHAEQERRFAEQERRHAEQTEILRQLLNRH